MSSKRIIIIGAGPTGLSLGYKLNKIGINDYLILEKNSYAGGLSASFTDKDGFIWDIGGHVIHEKNKLFNSFTKKILKHNVIKQKRKAYIYFRNKLIPYPFQNNIAFLPEKEKDECLIGLIKAQKIQSTLRLVRRCSRQVRSGQASKNFREWLSLNFGTGIAQHFIIPQNQKSWQYPLNKMGAMWLNNRVSFPSIDKIKKTCQLKNPKIIDWGSHQKFAYPTCGGIGQLWNKTAELLKNNIRFKTKLLKINFFCKYILVRQQGSVLTRKISFDQLVSTIPLRELIETSDAPAGIKLSAKQLKHNSGLIIGLGFNKKPFKHNWHWIYFPQKIYPFFRICLTSNFGPQVPPQKDFSSFVIEISWRNTRPIKEKVLRLVIKQVNDLFFANANLKPTAIFYQLIPYYYPIPTLDRDLILAKLNSFLKNKSVYSMGRFGSWLYEKGNMDDCYMEADKFIKKLRI